MSQAREPDSPRTPRSRDTGRGGWKCCRRVGTRTVFAEAQGAERHARLCQRLERLYGALELARLLDQGVLARWIETHIDAVRRDIEAD